MFVWVISLHRNTVHHTPDRNPASHDVPGSTMPHFAGDKSAQRHLVVVVYPQDKQIVTWMKYHIEGLNLLVNLYNDFSNSSNDPEGIVQFN